VNDASAECSPIVTSMRPRSGYRRVKLHT